MVEDKFSAREVATLIESLRSEFRSVTEVVLSLREDTVDVKRRVSALEDEVRLIKDILRIELPSLKSRVSALETKTG